MQVMPEPTQNEMWWESERAKWWLGKRQSKSQDTRHEMTQQDMRWGRNLCTRTVFVHHSIFKIGCSVQNQRPLFLEFYFRRIPSTWCAELSTSCDGGIALWWRSGQSLVLQVGLLPLCSICHLLQHNAFCGIGEYTPKGNWPWDVVVVLEWQTHVGRRGALRQLPHHT